MTQKYTTKKGIRKYNPAWDASQPSTATAVATAVATTTAVPFINQATALPVVPAFTAAYLEDEEIVVVPTSDYDAAVTKYHKEAEPEIYLGGYPGEGDSLDELNAVLAKYQVPAGMLTKLLDLKQFAVIEIIVDDSGSMRSLTDAKDPTDGTSMSRWWEAKWRISQMIEIMAYVPCAPIHIYFLHPQRERDLVLQRGPKEVPKAYIERVEGELKKAFDEEPRGTTPALRLIQESLERNADQRVLRYFMGDGVPDGGVGACREIETLIINRPSPENNPFTFMSCTNDDQAVEWMKETEEKAAYCSEFDDYLDEAREVLKDQGKAFPYSFGLHLVAQIVAAFNPHDLDAMDESVPFTQQVFENLLGYQVSPEEYRYYFQSFIEAQQKVRGYKPRFQQKFQRSLASTKSFKQFQTAAVANDIEEVVEYKQQLKNPAGAASRDAAPQGGCECIIM